MKPEEKRERIKYLWDKVRNYVNQMRFVKQTQKQMESQFLNQFAQKTELDENELKR